MNLSTINVTHSIESLSSSSSPELLNTNTMLTTNHYTINSNLPSIIQTNTKLNESFIHLIYSTCLNIFDKRLNDELNKFNEKYELLFNEYNETKYRLNKLETMIQYNNKMNIPIIPLPSSSSSSFLLPSSLTTSTSSFSSSSSSSSSDYLLTSLNSLKSQHFNESIIDNNNNNHNSHMMNTLKEIDTKWLMNWKNNNEDYLSSINTSKNNLLAPMLTTTTTTATTTRLDEQQQQSIQRIKDKIKDNHPIEFDINHLSNSFIDSSMNENNNDNNVNYPKHLFHESNISRLHNHFIISTM
ncbi:unnamed protein product [Schistosoma mattheei]|uniref:Uncharacterized protein n=1 Tax=Schistosoma mattheei TaxID=31246 RepID=A0AA85BR49_9TREM|nr:unnamed protein product [Schistosoma mattheei]